MVHFRDQGLPLSSADILIPRSSLSPPMTHLRSTLIAYSLFLLLMLNATASTSSTPASGSRPNIIFILCDDLGYGDTGPTYQSMRAASKDPAMPSFATPALEKFAAEGMQLRNHYSPAPVCAPSRASLLSGVTQGHASVRDNMFDRALGQNHTLGTVLQQAGYATAAIGKWGLQGGGEKTAAKGNSSPDKVEKTNANSTQEMKTRWPAYPTKRGFDYYFGYVRHNDGHLHYPKEDKKEIWENDAPLNAAGLDLCYTADLFTARAKKWITDHRAAEGAKPFFLYLAYDTPHAKLQYPPCEYPKGGGTTGGVQWLGKPGRMINSAAGKYDSWCHPDYAKATYDHDRNPKTALQPWPDMQKRYATSVRRIDSGVADLVQLLKDLNLDQNTLIVFTSDNGPSVESYYDEPYSAEFFRSSDRFPASSATCSKAVCASPPWCAGPRPSPPGRCRKTPRASGIGWPRLPISPACPRLRHRTAFRFCRLSPSRATSAPARSTSSMR